MPINTMSPAIVAALVQQVADGAISPASILSIVQAGQPISLGDWRVMFRKVKTGEFTVNTYEGENGEPLTRQGAASPVEAKLLAIEAAVKHYKDTHQNA